MYRKHQTTEKKWELIADEIPSRTWKQVRSHGQKEEKKLEIEAERRRELENIIRYDGITSAVTRSRVRKRPLAQEKNLCRDCGKKKNKKETSVDNSEDFEEEIGEGLNEKKKPKLRKSLP